MLSRRNARCLVILLLLSGGASLPAAVGPSPFLPPATSTDPVPTQDAAIELRGIMATDDGFMFSIYDSTHRSSTWLRLNETGREFVVRSHDAARDTVTVEHQGRTVTLALKTAKVSAAPAAQPVVANTPPPPNAPQPIGGPVVLNPTPADEQRRLEAIAAEVNRRRMLRQQALQASRAAGGQPAAGPTPTPTRPNGQQR